jgi:hypothetical protein
MNQELNVSLEQSTSVAAEQTTTVSAPVVLDDALLGQVGGGTSTNGPHGTW